MGIDTVSPLRQRMIEDMNARKLCAATQRGHIRSCNALARLPADRPQSAHPDRLGRPPGRRRPPRRGRPAPQNPAPAPQDPRQPRRRSTAITLAPPIPQPSPARPMTTQTTARRTQPAARNNHGGQATSPEPGSSRDTPGAHENVRPKRDDKSRSKVKTFWSPVTESNRRPSPYHACRFRPMASHQVGLPQVRPIPASERVVLRLALPGAVVTWFVTGA